MQQPCGVRERRSYDGLTQSIRREVSVNARATSAWPLIERTAPLTAIRTALISDPRTLHIVEGPAGSGKSTLVADLAREQTALEVVLVVGDAQRVTTPLAAFTEALRRARSLAAANDTAQLCALLAPDAARILLVVDDASRVDLASADVVSRLVRVFGARAIASLRSGEPLPHPLAELDAAGLARRHFLGGFDELESARVVEARFRVPARIEDVRRLHWQTGGNPLHLRVLVARAIARGEVIHRGEFVEFGADADTDVTGLAEMIGARLRELSPRLRRVLAAIALSQPTPAHAASAHLAREGEVAELTAHELVVVDDQGALRVSHPLVAEAIVQSGVSARMAFDAATLLRIGGDAAGRFAALEIERSAGMTLAADELVWAAGYALGRGQAMLGAELAEAAVALPAGRKTHWAAHLAAAGALSTVAVRGHEGISVGGVARVEDRAILERAEQHFDEAARLAESPAERATLMCARGDHLAHRRGDTRAALAAAESLRVELTGVEAVALDAARWRWRVLAERESRLQGGSDESDAEAARAAIAATIAAAMRGEPGSAREAADALAVPSQRLGELAGAATIARGVHSFVELWAQGSADDIAASLDASRVVAGDEVGFFTLMLGALRLQQGRLGDALEHVELSIEQLARWDGGELLPLARAVRATVWAQRGEATRAERELSWLDDHEVSGAAVLQREECRAFVLSSRGDRVGAARIIGDVVEDALASGYYFFGGMTLAAGLRFGEIERTAALATALRDAMTEESEPVMALAEVAVGMRERRFDAIDVDAGRLARAGLVPHACAALSMAAGMVGDDQRARHLRAAAARWGTHIDEILRDRAMTPKLSPRELMVATLAAERLRAGEIAARAGVSVRTVQNQLQSAYRKLGVSTRDDLRIALEGLLTNES